MKTQLKIFVFCFLISTFLSSQIIPIDKENKSFIIKLHIGIPKTVTSNQFRTAFNGFYDGAVSFNYKLFKNAYFGLGFQRTQFQNNRILREKVYNASIPYNTQLIGDCPFVKLSYDKYVKENAYINFAFNYGYMIGRYDNVNNDTSELNKPIISNIVNSHFVQPEISFNFIPETDKPLAITILASYTTLISKFDARAPRFKHFREINLKSNNYFMSWFTLGFGLNILIGKNS